MVVGGRVRVGSLAGPLRSLECVASGKSKGLRTANDNMEVRAQRQASILTKGRGMPRWCGLVLSINLIHFGT